MPIFGFFGALGVLELIFVGAFFLLLVVGASFDRRGREGPKWYIFGLGFLVIAAYYSPSFTLAGVWSTVTSWTFWQPVGTYLLAGLAYSLVITMIKEQLRTIVILGSADTRQRWRDLAELRQELGDSNFSQPSWTTKRRAP
jgi:hypothetical protein